MIFQKTINYNIWIKIPLFLIYNELVERALWHDSSGFRNTRNIQGYISHEQKVCRQRIGENPLQDYKLFLFRLNSFL